MKHFIITALLLCTLTACKHADSPGPLCPTDAGAPQVTAFSPNGDGHNDVFRVLYDNAHPTTSMELHIFNGAEEEVATVWGANGTWDGIDKRTGKICAPGRYRVEFGIISAGHGPYQIAADGERYVTLFGSEGGNCLKGQGCDFNQYTFEDQIKVGDSTLERAYATRESFCP